MTPATPRTAAGRALLDWFAPADNEHDHERARLASTILAIEAEAAALPAEPAGLREALLAEWYNGNIAEDVYDRIIAAGPLVGVTCDVGNPPCDLDTGHAGPHMNAAEPAGAGLRKALEAIEMVLAPGPPDGCENKCEGCRWETTEALRLIRAALAATPVGEEEG